MKKIFLSVLTISLVAVVALGATRAQLHDEETSRDDTYAAGTLDLKVDDQDDPNVASVLVEDMAPGDTAYQYWVLKNVGSICGKPSIEFSAVTNDDNGLTEPEETDGDITGGDGEGELGANSYAMMKWRQPVGSGAWHQVNLTNACGNPLVNGLAGLVVGEGLLNGCFDNYGYGQDTALPELCKDDEVEVQFRVWIMSSIGNIIQSDSMNFDVTFHLDQS